jgi:predicted dehydrogenase
VARELHAAGADVVAFVGTCEASLAAAAADLSRLGLPRARGYVGLDAMLEAEELDALAILSPVETHAACLEAALAARLHVLCEKPFVWGGPSPAATARALVDGFAARGLVLRENCPWPYALRSFEQLHPGVLERPPRRFSMRLSPSATGAAMLVDSLPHPLSLLQAVSGVASARVESPHFSSHDAAAAALTLRFGFRSEARDMEAEVELVGASAPPRQVWIAFDGQRARRRVQMPDYALWFEDGERSVPMADPLTGVVTDFVQQVRSATSGQVPARAEDVAWRMECLERLVSAFESVARRHA